MTLALCLFLPNLIGLSHLSTRDWTPGWHHVFHDAISEWRFGRVWSGHAQPKALPSKWIFLEPTTRLADGIMGQRLDPDTRSPHDQVVCHSAWEVAGVSNEQPRTGSKIITAPSGCRRRETPSDDAVEWWTNDVSTRGYSMPHAYNSILRRGNCFVDLLVEDILFVSWQLPHSQLAQHLRCKKSPGTIFLSGAEASCDDRWLKVCSWWAEVRV